MTITKPSLPWLHVQFDELLKNRQRLAHAYLMAGHAGLGKLDFSLALARALLCQEPTPHSCGHCQSCRLFDAGNHPDLHILQSERQTLDRDDLSARYAVRHLPADTGRKGRKPSTVIGIDQVRDCLPDIQSRPHIAARRVIVINAADDLYINAANSLLKVLEEPPPDTHFLLISHEPARLLPTIRSRCLRVNFRQPPHEQALKWLGDKLDDERRAGQMLARARGLPLRALTLADERSGEADAALEKLLASLARRQLDPVAAAAQLRKFDSSGQVLSWMQRYLADAIRAKLAPGERQQNTGWDLIDITKRLNFRELYEFLDMVSLQRRLLEGPLDENLAFEDILIRWQQMFSTRGVR
jgi:DNA polymerase-3 subunit delta'